MAYICAVRLNRTVGWKAFAEKSRGGMNRRGLSCHKGCNCGTKQDVSSCRKQHSNRAMRSIKDESDVRFKTGVENSVIAVVAAAFAVTMCIGFPGFACGAGQKEIVGQARVVDGDTLVIEEQRIRLYAIDAPETKQVCINDQREYNCGVISKSALEKRIDDRPVTCEAKKSLDKYGRQVAVCYVRENPSAEWEDLNAWMVKQVGSGHVFIDRFFVSFDASIKKQKPI